MLVRKPARQILFILLTAALTLASCNVGSTPAPAVDLDAVSTAAFNTAMAQISGGQTQTALAAPSATVAPTNTTNPLTTAGVPGAGTVLPTGDAALPTVSFNNTPTTPLAGFTPIGSPIAAAPAATTSLGDDCNNSAFEGDVTIPDGSVIEAGTNFEKIWSIRNTGSCTWDEGFSLVYIAGSKPDLDPYNFDFKKSSDFVASGQSINIALKLTAPCDIGKYEGHWRMRNDKGYYFGTLLSVYIEVKEKRKGCGS